MNKSVEGGIEDAGERRLGSGRTKKNVERFHHRRVFSEDETMICSVLKALELMAKKVEK